MSDTELYSRPVRDRSLLLFMAGDNDLSDAGLKDVDELCQEGASPNLHVAVEIDTRGEHTGAIRYEITQREATPDGHEQGYRTVIERLTESDTGNPSTLLNFIQWGMRRYPAKETILVVGGHGTGFREPNRSIAIDENGSGLTMSELEYVLGKAGLRSTPANTQARLGILGFDACLMGMLEVAAHVAPFARYLIASQEVEPANGWPYDQAAAKLKEVDDLAQAAQQIANAFVHQYEQSGKIEVTQSVINLDKTDVAMAALADFGSQVMQWLADGSRRAEKLRRIDRIRSKVQSFHYAEYVDARHCAFLFQEEFSTRSPIHEKAVQLDDTLDDCIFANCVSSEGQELENANGLSIWFPATKHDHIMQRQKYRKMSSVIQHPGWLDFLDFYHTL